MKNLLKKVGKRILIIQMILFEGFTTSATDISGNRGQTIPSLSSINGIEIAGLMALIIFLIIVLSAREQRKVH